MDRVLEDLLVRFLVNAPDEDLSSIERIFFQVEEAQWFYLDFVRQLNPLLPNMKMKSFAPALLSKCPLLWRWGDPRDAITKFGKYKSTIPVRGIALMNKDLTKVILVQGMESGSWSFPRGKISKAESDLECAIREVREETGFDARAYVNEKDYVERTIFGKNMKIFLARGVPDDTEFAALTRFEISLIKWFDLKKLKKSLRSTPLKFFAVEPLFKAITTWVNEHKGEVNEEDVIREAEAKLKAFMGIGVSKENDKAGRELLDILQGAAQQEPQSQQVKKPEFTVPQLSQFPNFNHQMLAGFPPNAFLPQQPLPQAHYPMLPPAHLLPHGQQAFMPPPHLLRPPQEANIMSTPSRQLPQPQIQQPYAQAPIQVPQLQAQQPAVHKPQVPARSQPPPIQHTPQELLKLKESLSVLSPKELPKEVQHLLHYQTQPLEPSAQSLSLPKRISTSKNSKEFLSLLNKAPKGSQTEEDPQATSDAKQRNRSRADELLKLFQKQEPNEKPLTPKPHSEKATKQESLQPHLEEPEETALEDPSRSNTPKKITLLKRETDLNASATLLGLLGKKPPQKGNETPSQVSDTQPAQHSSKKPAEQPVTSPVEDSGNASATLLGILNGKKSAPIEEPASVSSPQPVSLSASADLLGILKRGKTPEKTDHQASTQTDKPIRIAKKNADTPIDLKAILTGQSQKPDSSEKGAPEKSEKKAATRTSSGGNDILDLFTRKSDTPDSVRITPQQSQTPETFDDFENFEDLEENEGYINTEGKQFHESTDDEDFEDAQDAHVVPPSVESTKGAVAFPLFQAPDNLHDIYGGSGNETINLQSALPKLTHSDNGANLLALLGKKPPSQAARVGIPKPQDSGRSELLSILRRGAN